MMPERYNGIIKERKYKMFEIDLRILKKMTDELGNCEKRLVKQAEQLALTISSLHRIEMEGMDRAREGLRKRLEDLRTEIRKVRSMRQALERICLCYEQCEEKTEGLFEEQTGVSVVWQTVRLTGIRNLLR